MAKPTQQELMAAHNVARNNALEVAAKAEAEGKSVPQVVGNKNVEPFEPEHPFGGNDNNRRVAERIVKEGAKLKQASAPVPLTGAEAAAADLKLADAFDALAEPELTDKELAARDDAATAAALAAQQAAGAPPAPPAPANPPAPPPPTEPPPAWKGNA
jgi:thioesterase domain-containing protein